jgi:hypothetical protein
MSQSPSAATGRRIAAAAVVLGAAALTSACATPRPAGETTSLAAPTASAPVPAPGYDWFFNADPAASELSLSYGVADSDDVPLSLSCHKGDGALMLLRSAAPPRTTLALESGGETETYPAKAEPSPLHGGHDLTAQARAADPVFQRFRRLGWLAVLDGESRLMMAGHPGATQRVEAFFAACG